MPRRYKKKTPARRRYKVKKARRNTKAKIGRSMGSPIADRFLCTLPYSELFALQYFAAGAPAVQQFQVNSIFKPNITATGHQPLGRDDYFPFYNRYLVRGMSYQIHITSTSTTETGDIAVFKRPDTTYTAVMDTILESPQCQRRQIPPYVTKPVFIKGYCSVAKMCGVNKAQMDAKDIYASLMTTNPSQVPCLNIALSNQNTAANLTIRLRVLLKFYVLLYDRKPLTGS